MEVDFGKQIFFFAVAKFCLLKREHIELGLFEEVEFLVGFP